jgi:hypothetical protein
MTGASELVQESLKLQDSLKAEWMAEETERELATEDYCILDCLLNPSKTVRKTLSPYSRLSSWSALLLKILD